MCTGLTGKDKEVPWEGDVKRVRQCRKKRRKNSNDADEHCKGAENKAVQR